MFLNIFVNFGIYFWESLLIFYVTLCLHIACRSPIWVMWVGIDIIKSVYLRSFLTTWNFATSKSMSRMKQQ